MPVLDVNRVAARAEVVLRQRLEQREERIRELKDTASAKAASSRQARQQTAVSMRRAVDALAHSPAPAAQVVSYPDSLPVGQEMRSELVCLVALPKLKRGHWQPCCSTGFVRNWHCCNMQCIVSDCKHACPAMRTNWVRVAAAPASTPARLLDCCCLDFLWTPRGPVASALIPYLHCPHGLCLHCGTHSQCLS